MEPSNDFSIDNGSSLTDFVHGDSPTIDVDWTASDSNNNAASPPPRPSITNQYHNWCSKNKEDCANSESAAIKATLSAMGGSGDDSLGSLDHVAQGVAGHILDKAARINVNKRYVDNDDSDSDDDNDNSSSSGCRIM